jgi:hypothetical protein
MTRRRVRSRLRQQPERRPRDERTGEHEDREVPPGSGIASTRRHLARPWAQPATHDPKKPGALGHVTGCNVTAEKGRSSSRASKPMGAAALLPAVPYRPAPSSLSAAAATERAEPSHSSLPPSWPPWPMTRVGGTRRCPAVRHEGRSCSSRSPRPERPCTRSALVSEESRGQPAVRVSTDVNAVLHRSPREGRRTRR